MLYCKFQSKLISFLLLGVFSALLFTSNAFAQQTKLVESLDILGNRRLTDDELVQHIKTRPGERFNEKQVQEDLQSLLKLGLFNTSQTRVSTEIGGRGGVNVIFEVMELPLVVELKFNGLRYVTKEELLAELREKKAEVTVNTPFHAEKLQKARQVILNYLAKKRGFVDPKVYATEEEVSATTVIVSFIIDELPNDEENLL